MASAAQISANRRNAQFSTGPTSPTGKVVSSQNSTKHGLSGSTTAALMAAPGSRDLLEKRKGEWIKGYAPEDESEAWLFEQVVAESIRVDRCTDAYFELCREHGRRAQAQWDADRRREADELAGMLAKAPQTVARRLEATPQGCDLMLEYWRGLAASLEKHRTWTDAQRSLVLDLLAVHPELRDAETPIDPAEGDVLEVRRAVISAEVARLTALRDGALAVLDAEARARAEASLGAELTKPLQLVDRYERAACRRLEWARRRLDASRRERDASPPAPVPAPASVKMVVAPAPSMPRPSATFVAITATSTAPAPARTLPAADPGRTIVHRGPNRHERRAQAAMAGR